MWERVTTWVVVGLVMAMVAVASVSREREVLRLRGEGETLRAAVKALAPRAPTDPPPGIVTAVRVNPPALAAPPPRRCPSVPAVDVEWYRHRGRGVRIEPGQ